MGNLVGKGSTDPEDSTESNKETTAADVGIVSYEPHLDIYQDKAKSTPHSPATKSGAETSENGENVTVDLKGKGWRKNSSATAHTGKPERQRLEIQNRGSINDVSEIGRLQGGPSTGPASNPVGLNQNAASHKSDAKRDGEVASHSHKKKVLKPWITVESDNTKGLKGPFGKLANQSRKYSDPNLEDTSNGSGVQFDNSNAYPVYKRCKMLSPTDNNGDDSVFPGPRKNSLGGQSLSSEYGPPADDVSEDTSSTPWDGSPNQDYMKLYWSSRGSKDSNSSQRRASDNLVKVVGEISILQQELQELLSEKERTRTAGMEEPHLLGSPSGSLRSRLKGYSIHNSSEALHSSDTEMRLIELAKSWQSRLLNIQKMTDSSLKDLESPTATQDKQQKTSFSGDPEVRTILTEDGKQDVKQLEVEVKRLQSLLAQQENENKNLTMVKNKEIRDLSQEESQLKMELLAKESELKVLREKALSLEKALEQAHRECKAQLDKTLSLEKALERGHREHRADIEKVASLEKTLQQELREHRAETERVVTLEKVLEQERREHRAETERAMSLEKTLEQARSEHRVQIERASSLKKTLEQADSMQRVRTDRALSLEKELERTQDDLRAQTERASSLENSLNQLSSELKAQTERALSLEKEQSLRLDMETTLIRMRDLARQLEGEKTELQKKLQDLQEKMQADAEEWRQFQADLQTAVAVADDFKMEAEEELLATREKLWDVEKENERLKMELGRRKGTDTVDHGSYLEKRKEEAPNSLIGLPAVNGISRVRKTLHAESTAPSIQTDTEIPGSLRTTSLVKKAPRITFQTTGNESSLAKNEERRAQQRNPVALEASLSELNKTREKSPDKPGSQVRRYGGSRRNTLLQWCQSRTLGYKNIEITNFSVCWSDGMSLCALFHSYLPDRIPYGELNPAHKKQNLTLAFETGKSIGIPQTLSVEEMLDRDGPDWQSVLGYVESIYQHFEQ